MYLLDTNVLSELRKKPGLMDAKVEAWARALPAGSAYLSSLTLLEIERGTAMKELKDPPAGVALRAWVEGVKLAYKGRILPFGDKEAVRCAQIAGSKQPTIDNMIAATAMCAGMVVATRNVADFTIAGLLIVNPWS